MKLHIKEMQGYRGNAYSSSRRLLNAIKFNENKMIAASEILREDIQYEPLSEEKGGIIVFSEESNTVQLSSDKLINCVKQKISKLNNRFHSKRTIDEIANVNKLIGWTAGNYLSGRYKAKNGICYGEKSLSIEITGVYSNTLIKIAEQLCAAFKQESVLLKDYSNNRILFVDTEMA